jgi:alkylation response protein AidB-like acyl-CoA dehydrogenase
MSLKLTPEQKELQNSVRKFFTDELSSAALRKRIESGVTHDPALWKKVNELALFEYFGSAEAGGASFRDLGLVAFETGRALFPEPLIDALYCGSYLGRNGALRNVLSAEVSNSIAGGEKRIAIGVSANGMGSFHSGKFTGEVLVRGSALNLSHLIVSGQGDESLLVSLDKETHRIETPAAFDLTLPSTVIKFEKAASAKPLLDKNPLDMYRILLALELCGAASKTVEMTVDYVKTRKQFGVPIGAFQAVQHQLADMHLLSEASRSLSFFASWTVENSKDQLPLAARSAISYAASSAPQIIEKAIQLHGGIGFTWEFDLHLYLRRAKAIEALWGATPAEYAQLVQVAAAV